MAPLSLGLWEFWDGIAVQRSTDDNGADIFDGIFSMATEDERLS